MAVSYSNLFYISLLKKIHFVSSFVTVDFLPLWTNILDAHICVPWSFISSGQTACSRCAGWETSVFLIFTVTATLFSQKGWNTLHFYWMYATSLSSAPTNRCYESQRSKVMALLSLQCGGGTSFWMVPDHLELFFFSAAGSYPLSFFLYWRFVLFISINPTQEIFCRFVFYIVMHMCTDTQCVCSLPLTICQDHFQFCQQILIYHITSNSWLVTVPHTDKL